MGAFARTKGPLQKSKRSTSTLKLLVGTLHLQVNAKRRYLLRTILAGKYQDGKGVIKFQGGKDLKRSGWEPEVFSPFPNNHHI